MILYFNSQPHEEADVSLRITHDASKVFQLTASRRGWRERYSLSKTFETFQLTASRRGWPDSKYLTSGDYIFQLTASRRGWLNPAKENSNNVYISTHSLTKRLTMYSICRNSALWFQLTASRRGWQWLSTWRRILGDISTHSLTKRLTVHFPIFISSLNYFNSQPHEEADFYPT